MPDLRDIRAAFERATHWLAGQQLEDGSVQPVQAGLVAYHKVPYAFCLAGRIEAAARLLDWIRDNDLRETGDLAARYDRREPYAEGNLVPNAWVVAAAQRLAQYDIAQLGTGFLLAEQREDGPFGGHDGPDAEATACCGLALLQVGQFEAAQRAGDWLLQSDALAAAPSGAVAAFWVRLCRSTRGARYLLAARELLDRARENPDRAPTVANAQLGRGAALTFGVTADRTYERMAFAIASQVVEVQSDEGHWRGLAPEGRAERTVDVTAELAACLGEMVEGLAMGSRPT